MEYSRFVPNSLLKSIVECYWIVEGDETGLQKIIPDGCTEFIFHFGAPFNISKDGRTEELQSLLIAAGQLEAPIFLRPTGKSGVLGIKFQPTGMWKLFGCEMNLLTNETYDLRDVFQNNFNELAIQIQSANTNIQRINLVEIFLSRELSKLRSSHEMDWIVGEIKNKNGQVSLRDLSLHTGFSSRKIERLFKQQVGVSPKLYSRLIRFCYAHNLLQQRTLTKVEATYLSGYFDQPHFNKEFREFTGENPESYLRGNHTFSNFFLNT